MFGWSRGVLVLTASVVGCTGTDTAPREGLLAEPLGPWPETIADVGIYPDPGRREERAAAAVAYAPLWPLWSNGAAKERLLVLPEDAVVDNHDRARWELPVGTLLFKTFSFGGVPVETRVLRRTADGGWDYGAYLWDEAGTDAERLALDRAVEVEITDDGTTFVHQVPSRLECRECHEGGERTVLGFDELQLGSALAGLAAQGVFAVPVPDAPDAIDARDPLTRDVMGDLTGNCVHCHDGSGGLDLRHDRFVGETVGVPTESSASGAGIRIVAGAPDDSVLYRAVAGGDEAGDVRPMPPVGVQRRDDEAVDRLRRWIEEMRP